MHPIAGAMAKQTARPAFRKPSDDAIDQSSRSGSLLMEERLVSEENASLVISNPFLALSIQQQRSRLPIFKYRSHILYLLEKFRAVIVIGETGCGKSTQLPQCCAFPFLRSTQCGLAAIALFQYLMETGWSSDGRKIGVTQPRRIAAVTVRCFENSYLLLSFQYLTDGILLREFMSDPLLTQYSILMIDEAHERSLNTDVILGLLRKVMAVRQDLRIIVSSATLDAVVNSIFHLCL
ncbi:unnamed protein product [Gongylonema pulchrum]|uniref:Helicase ATP-binding domain-containing protein n=1 Tax=Gongylonema pulchrum TaxID=637853 RepID=A0A183E6S0_9BILA|nr:unnamed protein product [Gongylonema pulchrum]